MSNSFINDHKVGTVRISKILRITAGGFHAWCESNVGIIRKPGNVLSNLPCWYDFWNLPKPEIKIVEDVVLPDVPEKIEPLLKWWQKIWRFITNLLKR
ncbi:MAG: hypothetical protein PHW73_13910 [Atribacterota bacterium]|nr:hypothetical protein [Atribacterota bacterium]